MPLPLAALVALALGGLFAHVARAELAASDAPVVASRAMKLVVAFAWMVYMPAVAYFAAFHGDWAYMYFIAWHRVPSAVDLVVVLAVAALVPAAFLAVAPWSRSRRSEVVAVAVGAPAALAVVMALVLEKRLGTNSTFVHFTTGLDTRPVAASTLGRAALVAISICTAAALWCVHLLRTPPQKRVV